MVKNRFNEKKKWAKWPFWPSFGSLENVEISTFVAVLPTLPTFLYIIREMKKLIFIRIREKPGQTGPNDIFKSFLRKGETKL